MLKRIKRDVCKICQTCAFLQYIYDLNVWKCKHQEASDIRYDILDDEESFDGEEYSEFLVQLFFNDKDRLECSHHAPSTTRGKNMDRVLLSLEKKCKSKFV